MRPPGPVPWAKLGLIPCSAAKRRARGLMRPASSGMLAAGIVGWFAAGTPFGAKAPIRAGPVPGSGDRAAARFACTPVVTAPGLPTVGIPVVADGAGASGR